MALCQKDTLAGAAAGLILAVLLTFLEEYFSRCPSGRSRTDKYPKLRIMSIDQDFGGRQSQFGRMMDELDEADTRRSASGGAERLWPGACATPRGHSYFQTGAVESLYAESQSGPYAAAAAEKPENRGPTPDIAAIRRELAAARSLDDLNRLRRRCALAAHPDRVGPLERPMAEKLMAEVNASIDKAIKDKALMAQKS